MKATRLIAIAALISLSAGSSFAEPAKKLHRTFQHNAPEGQASVIRASGAHVVGDATLCTAEWMSYQYNNDPKRSSATFLMGISTDAGNVFDGVSFPVAMVPPFQLLPDRWDRNWQAAGSVYSHRDQLDGDLLTVTTFERLLHVLTKTIDTDTTTTVTIHVNKDVSRAWDMTFSQVQYKYMFGKRLPVPTLNVTTKCSGEFAITENEVLDQAE